MNACRFCLNNSNNNQFNLLSTTYSAYIQLVIPEIDLNLTEAPQICSVCLNSLEDAYNFKTRCLESEDQLKSMKNIKIKHEVEEDYDETLPEVTNNCTELDNGNENFKSTWKVELKSEIEENYNQLENENGNVGMLWIKKEVVEDYETSKEGKNHIELENNIVIKEEIELNENEIMSSENIVNLSTLEKEKRYPDRYICNQCGKTFPFKCRLQNHMVYHSEEKTNVCEICGKGFHLMVNLKVHMKIHRNVRITPYQCSDCGIKFDENENLPTNKCYHCDGKIIIKVETEENEFDTKTQEKLCECDVCGKKYVSNSSLQRHKMIHSGEMRIKCDVCGKGFKQISELKSHLRTHNKENGLVKPYKCGDCGNRFLKIPYLQRHKRVYCRAKNV